MTITALDLNDTTQYPRLITELPTYVWTRAKWADPWTPRPDLNCISLRWATFPDIDSATLRYHYGRDVLPGKSDSSIYSPIEATTRGYWVLIRVPMHDGDPLTWLGFAESPRTLQHSKAVGNLPQTGVQEVPCFGMGRVLQQSLVRSTVHVDPADDTKLVRAVNVGAEFNARVRPSRSATKLSLPAPSTVTAYAFTLPDDDAAESWSSRDIVEHLLAFQMPTLTSTLPNDDSDPADEIPWRIGELSPLPDWDEPRVATDARTLTEILQELILAERLLGLTIQTESSQTLDPGQHPHAVDADLPTVDSVTIDVVSFASDAITLPDSHEIPAAADQIELTCTTDSLTQLQHDIDAADVVDQIVIAGPREISVCTLYVDEQLKIGWDSADETTYAAGGSAVAGYSAKTPSEKSALDRRERERYYHLAVFRDLRLDPQWDGTISAHDAFVKNDPADATHVPYPGLLEILDYLPLFEGVDYSGDPTTVVESDGYRQRSPLVTLKHPSSDKRLSTESLAKLKPGELPKLKPFAFAAVSDNDKGPGLRIQLSGAPQHAIAGTAFTGTTGDPEQEVYGGLDYDTLEATVALRGNRRAEWQLPADDDLADADVVRRRVYTFDWPSLQLVYIAEDTVVDIDNAGDEIKSDGGLLRDPIPELESLAKTIAKYAHSPTHAIDIATPRRINVLRPGTMIRTVDNTNTPRVDAVISEVRIESPQGDGKTQDQAMMYVKASSGRVDIFSLLPGATS